VRFIEVAEPGIYSHATVHSSAQKGKESVLVWCKSRFQSFPFRMFLFGLS